MGGGGGGGGGGGDKHAGATERAKNINGVIIRHFRLYADFWEICRNNIANWSTKLQMLQ